MKKTALLLAFPLLALSACGEEPAPEPVATEVATPEPTPTVPAPSEALFSEILAEACPTAEPVNTGFCQRGLGADHAICEFGLGDDEYTRNEARLEIDESGEAWALADAETLCEELSN